MRFIGSIIAFLFTISAFSQDAFHRAYPLISDTSVVNISATQFESGEYVSLDGMKIKDDSVFFALLVTQYEVKGGINWTTKLTPNDLGFSMDEGKIFTSGDSIYFSATLFKKDGPNKLIGVLDRKGKYFRSSVLGNTTPLNSALGLNSIVNNLNAGIVQYTNFGDENSPSTVITKLNANNGIAFSKKYTPLVNQNADINSTSDVTIALDSSIAITGLLNNLKSCHLTVIDTLGQIKFSKAYTSSNLLFPTISGLSVVQDLDSNFIMCGKYDTVDLLNPVDTFQSSFIMKTDKTGNLLWSKKVNDTTTVASFISNAVVNDDKSIVVAGVITSTDTSSQSDYFISKLDQNGNLIWAKTYPRSPAFLNSLGNLFKVTTGGYAYFNTAVESISNKSYTNFIRANDLGITTCQDTISNLFIDFPMQSTTLTWNVQNNETAISDYVLNEKPFSEFDVPKIKKETKQFCPNEPIDFTFRATVKGAVSYLWNDGSTADTLRVKDDEKYSVIVTIDDKYCFTLCDTFQVSKYKTPTAAIEQSCQDGQVKLTASGSGGLQPIISYIWTTGENTSSILIPKTNPGTYVVTIADNCGSTASATTNVSFKFDVNITSSENECHTTSTLAAQPLGGTAPFTYKWSTGATEDKILINRTPQNTTYSVTVVDACGKEGVGTITNAFTNLEAIVVNISSSVQNPCPNESITLTANASKGTGGVYVYKWSTGSTESAITIPATGNYTVTVTDKCGTTASTTYGVPAYIPVSVVISSDKKDFCTTDKVSLIAQGNSGIQNYTYQWSTNESTQLISVENAGLYTVTVTDKCGTTNTASLDFVVPTNDDGSAPLQFAKVFWPGTTALEANRYFGALNKDTVDITNFEFHVFNRFGKEVFTTTDPTVTWDGTNGNTNPNNNGENNNETDVYVYYCTYSVGKCSYVTKGNVTLFR